MKEWRSERVQLRVTPTMRKHFSASAGAVGTSVSDFMMVAALLLESKVKTSGEYLKLKAQVLEEYDWDVVL